MNVIDKYNSLDNAILEEVDAFPVALNVTKEEKDKISLWISKALAIAYDTGFKDGKNSK